MNLKLTLISYLYLCHEIILQMLLYISLSGILLSVILFAFSARLYKSSRYLAGFIFLISLYSLFFYILFYSESVYLVSIAYINLTSIFYLIGPMIYWYIRSLLTDNYRLRKSDAIHLLPALIFLINSLPYIFGPYHEKLIVATELVKNIDHIGIYKPTLLHSLISIEVIFLSRTVLVFAYTLASIWLLFRYLRSGKSHFIMVRQHYMTKWLMTLLGFLLVLTISHSLLIFKSVEEENSRLFYTLNFLQVLTAIGLSGLLISPLFYPTILYGLPLVPEVSNMSIAATESVVYIDAEDKKVKLPVFESDYLMQMNSIIENLMLEEKVYLTTDLNLPRLSVLTQIPVHHLAYFFREHLNQSFHDYRNGWRVEHAKMLIMEGKAKELTLEAIGTLSGFSSRNTFFIAFKRVEGISPGEFTSRAGCSQ